MDVCPMDKLCCVLYTKEANYSFLDHFKWSTGIIHGLRLKDLWITVLYSTAVLLKAMC